MTLHTPPLFGSLFSGIGGFDLGLERAGWECRWQVEIDPWRRQVLARHWPDVPRWGDVRTFPNTAGTEPPRPVQRGLGVDLICGGFPCQDLSVAGKRAGLAGERSGLFFEFARIAQELRPTWLLIENVPGLLTASKGHDFAVVVDTLADIGFGLAWRILDSQYFGVPQRRRRVYIVGHLGAPCPPEILFEPEGGGGDTPAGGKAGESVAHALRSSPRGVDEHTGTTYIAEVCPVLRAGKNRTGGDRPPGTDVDTCESLIAQPLRSNRWGGSDSHGDEGNVVCAHALSASANAGLSHREDSGNYVCAPADPNGMRAPTELPRWLDPHTREGDGMKDDVLVQEPSGIWRPIKESDWQHLEPCPRCPDGRRYAALGDAVTVNVIQWIGARLLKAHEAAPCYR